MSCPRLGEVCHEYTCGVYAGGTCSSGENLPNSTGTSLPETSCNIPMTNVRQPKAELISAAEAYGRTQENLRKKLSKKILEAIEENKLSIRLRGAINHEVKEELENLGYEVKSELCCDEYLFIVSWEKEGY